MVRQSFGLQQLFNFIRSMKEGSTQVDASRVQL
jgi:hypothetical protein